MQRRNETEIKLYDGGQCLNKGKLKWNVQMGALSCGFKNYYRNLRFMSITLKIYLFITFNHGTIIQTFVL